MVGMGVVNLGFKRICSLTLLTPFFPDAESDPDGSAAFSFRPYEASLRR